MEWQLFFQIIALMCVAAWLVTAVIMVKRGKK